MSWLRALGFVKRAANQGVTYTDLQNVGTAALATILDRVVARQRAIGGTPIGGVYGSDLLCTEGSGTREVDVAVGTLFHYDATVTSLYAPSYTPRYVAAATLTLAANSSGSARYDLIVVTPGTTDGDTSDRRVKSTVAGASSLSSLANHTAYTGALSVVAGIPGAGPPATPVGTVKLAECLVTNGATVAAVYDKRVVIGNDYGVAIPWASGALVRYSVPVVQSGLAVTAAGSSMVVAVTAGVLDFQGRRYFVEADSFTLTAADPSDDRFDVVLWDTTVGRLSVLQGSPGGGVPITGNDVSASGACYLAVVRVVAADTEVVQGDITDIRRAGPYHGASESVPSVRPWVSSIAASSSNLRAIDFAILDRDGVPFESQVYVRIKVHNLEAADGDIAADKAGVGDATTGAFVLGEDTASALFLTDTNGEGSFSAGAINGATGNYLIDFEVTEYLAALTSGAAVSAVSPLTSSKYRGDGKTTLGIALTSP